MAKLYVMFQDGSHYDIATDTAAAPTGEYGWDWAVSLAEDDADAKRIAWDWCRNCTQHPFNMVSEMEARGAFDSRVCASQRQAGHECLARINPDGTCPMQHAHAR